MQFSDENALLGLLSRVCDDLASDEELKHLAAAIQQDARVRLLYLQFLTDHAELQCLDGARPLIDLEPILESRVDYQKVFAQPVVKAAAARENSSSARPLPPALRDGTAALARFLNQIPVFSLIAAAACSFAFLTALAVWRMPQRAWSPPASADDAPLASVAKIIDERHALWRGRSDFEGAGSLPVGQMFELDAGLAEISFGTGARVIVEGPVQFKILDANSIRLQRGKLYAVLRSASAQGFVVRTPHAKITDLGTEFGVWASGGGETEVSCFEGSVLAQAIHPQSEAQILTRGQTVSFRAAQSPAAAAGDLPWMSRTQPRRAFVRRLSNQPLVEKPFYSDVVRSLEPVGYWRFEASQLLPEATDSSERGHPGKLIDEASLAPQAGLIGDALWLDGKHAYVSIPDDPDFHFGARSFTFSGWMRVNQSQGDHTLIGKGDSRKRPGVVWNGRIDPSGRFRFGGRDATTAFNTFETAPGPDLRDNRWHHLVGVFDRDSKEQRYYVDGRQTHVRLLDDLPEDVTFDGADPLKIGLADLDQYAAGWIDEVALFDRALDDRQVQELFSARRQ